MVADTSIYSMLRPGIQLERQPSRFEEMGQMLTLKQLMDSGLLQDSRRRALETDLTEQEAFKRAFRGPGQVSIPELYRASPTRALQFEKGRLEAQKTRGQIGKTEIESLNAEAKYYRDLAAQVRDQAGWSAFIQDARARGSKFVESAPAAYSPQAQRALVMDATTFIEQTTPRLARVTMPDGSIRTIDENPVTNPQAAQFQAAPGMTPAQQATTDQGAARLAFETGVGTSPGTATASGAPGLTPKQQSERAVEKVKRDEEVRRALNSYIEARNGLMSGLAGTTTGFVVGRVPAMTAAQQISEGGIAAMAPVLKQLFRVSGEGVFTDKDQELLLDMVPKRTDEQRARIVKMSNIDRIVEAKLGMEIPDGAAVSSGTRMPGAAQPTRDEIDNELRRRGVIR